MDFWWFSRNNTIVSIPGKLSQIHLHVWLFSNPQKKVLFLWKSMGQICPLDLILLRTFPCWLENNHACKWISNNFPGMLTYVLFLKKLSEILLHVWLFSNPQGKDVIIVRILRSLDLRVQPIEKVPGRRRKYNGLVWLCTK